MAIRKCTQCGTTVDDRYGFCIKCGKEFPDIEQEINTCPLCGFKNPDEAEYCVKCGTPLIFKKQFEQQSNAQIKPIVITKDGSKNSEIPDNPKKVSSILILLGYVFSILGGVIGLIIAIYLSTRKDPVARKHGYIQLAIFIFYLALIAVFIATGQLTLDTIANYDQYLFGNITSFHR